MVVLKQLLEHTNVVSQYLQSKQIDLGAAVSSVQATLNVLKGYRSEEKFHECFEMATSLAEMLGAEVPTILSTRRKKVSQRLDELWQTEHHQDTVESKNRAVFLSSAGLYNRANRTAIFSRNTGRLDFFQLPPA